MNISKLERLSFNLYAFGFLRIVDFQIRMSDDKEELVLPGENVRPKGKIGIRHLVVFMGWYHSAYINRYIYKINQIAIFRIPWFRQCLRDAGELVGRDRGDGQRLELDQSPGKHHDNTSSRKLNNNSPSWKIYNNSPWKIYNSTSHLYKLKNHYKNNQIFYGKIQRSHNTSPHNSINYNRTNREFH